MKICYINPTNNIRRPIVELSRLLADQGHIITVVYPSSKECKTKGFHFIQLLDHKNITVIPINSYYYKKLRYSLPKPLELLRKARQVIKDNDIIHIWEYYYPISVLPLLLKIFNIKKKFILTSDGFVGYSYKPKYPWWLVPAFKLYTQLFARLLFHIPNIFTTYGKAMIPFANKAGVPKKKLRVLGTGIDLKKFQPTNPGKIRQEFKIDKEFTILFVGMLTERKNVDIVIKVSDKLLDNGYNIKTLIVGEGPNEEEFKAIVKHKDKILFTGGRKDVQHFYTDSNVLLLPSMGEGLPGVVMEAMALKLACIATDEGCTPDLIQNKYNGILVRPYDEEGFYKAVLSLLNNKDLITKISTNSRNTIEAYDWNIVKEKYLDIYNELLS